MIEIIVSGNPTSVGDIDTSPTNFVLQQNYPNPFNPSTTIQFSLSRKEHVTQIRKAILMK